VSRVVAGSAAADAGFRPDDKIVGVNGRAVTGWDQLKAAIERNGGKVVTFALLRDGLTLDVEATLKEQGGQGFLGIGPSTAFRDVGVFEAIPESLRTMGDITTGTVEGFGRLFSPSGVAKYSENFTSAAPKAGTPAADARPRSLIGIVDEGSTIIDGNVWALLWLLGGISLILALFNTIPLLPFDGGHAAVVIYEWAASKVKGKEVRVDFRKLMPVTAVVLAIFLTLGLSAMFLDIKQVVGK
jgi:membrane-associated protease RseP (regulator of RpoE activity)